MNANKFSTRWPTDASKLKGVLRRRLTPVLAGALMVTGLALAAQPTASADSSPLDPTDPLTPATVSADGLPTTQINGVVWSQAVVGNKVYAGGSFTQARPAGAAPGTNQVPRANLLSYDVTTGELIASFAPVLNGAVRAVAVSPDGSRVYVGGAFTSVDGQTRNRIAAFDAASGALIAGFAPPVNYDVLSIVATNSTVYAGGDFQSVGTQNRGYLAAFNASNGALLDWAPQAAGGKVWALAMNPEGTKIAVGGEFNTLNGSSNPGYGLGIVDATTGASLPAAINTVVRNAGVDAAITSLSADADGFYGGGYVFGAGGNFEGTFGAGWDGSVKFTNDCHGDTYATYPRGGAIYTAGHTHFCGNMGGFPQTEPDWSFSRGLAFGKEPTGVATREFYGYANFQGKPTSALLTWFPSINAGTFTGQAQGPWTVSGNADYVVMAGEFTKVNGTQQQGLVRFPAPEVGPNDEGPTTFAADYPLNVSSTEAGKVRINWSTNRDIDNDALTYKVYRDVVNGSGLVYQTRKRANYWAPYTMGVTDSGLVPGSTHQYRVQAWDSFGNVANSPWTSITVAASGTDSAYLNAVYASQPTSYWRLGDPTGSTAADRVGFSPLTTGSGVTENTAGAIAGDADKAVTVSGSNSQGSTSKLISPPNTFTLEGWFRTSGSFAGGRIMGFSNKQSGNSSKFDRLIYMDSNGRIQFGVNDGSAKVVTSPGSYRNNAWHHVVATLSQSGMKLYLDGAQVAQRADVTFGQGAYWGYWRIGADTLSGWPSRPLLGDSLSGSIDEAAVYNRELSADEVAVHYATGTGAPPPNLPPAAAYTWANTDLTATFDGSGSSDSDGTVVSYAWNYGDGQTGTGANASHTYAAAGTYNVQLTVTDDDGGTASITKPVTVTAPPPNVPPTASFTTSLAPLSVSVDGSASSDSDGTITSYAWTFGDGATGTGATASHSYAAGGTYDVSLTVTDDDGDTGTLTKQVTVDNVQVAFATDAFGRTVATGWGSADLGGAWTTTGSTSNFSVADGVGAMRMTAGAGRNMNLNGVSSADAELRVSVGMDKVATGGGIHATIKPRVVGSNSYWADLTYAASGSVSVTLGRTVAGVDTTVASQPTGLSVVAGERLNVKVQVTGVAPTTLRVKIWKVGTAEPAGWTATATDSTAGLQAAGSLRLETYLSGSATNAPVVASFDDLWAGSTP